MSDGSKALKDGGLEPADRARWIGVKKAFDKLAAEMNREVQDAIRSVNRKYEESTVAADRAIRDLRQELFDAYELPFYPGEWDNDGKYVKPPPPPPQKPG